MPYTSRWENIEPALPAEVGTIRLEDVCELGTLDYVVHFERYLLPEDSHVVTRPPRIMVEDDAWEQVCSGLISRGVCEAITSTISQFCQGYLGFQKMSLLVDGKCTG